MAAAFTPGQGTDGLDRSSRAAAHAKPRGALVPSRGARSNIVANHRLERDSGTGRSRVAQLGSPPIYPYLAVAGRLLGKPGLYAVKLQQPAENFVLDARLRFGCPWGSIELGVTPSLERRGGVQVLLKGQPDGQGLCTQLVCVGSTNAADNRSADILGHPQPGIEYVLRLALPGRRGAGTLAGGRFPEYADLVSCGPAAGRPGGRVPDNTVYFHRPAKQSRAIRSAGRGLYSTAAT